MIHDAFISYSHEADGNLTPAIESGLEKLARPLLKLRAMDVFRDETSLAANPGLWSGIVSHLSQSRWFVLMASPKFAKSEWCKREVAWWLENRDVDRMLVLLTDGEIIWDSGSGDFDWTKTTALSSELQGRFTEVPLYVDLRWAKTQAKLSLADSRFRDAILDVAAPIRGIPKDQLEGEDVRQLKRNKRFVRGLQGGITGAAVIAMVLAFVAWTQRDEARRQRDEAIRQARVALSQKLSAEAVRTPDDHVDRALLLAVTALDVYETSEARVSLLATLLRGNYVKFERGWERSTEAGGKVAGTCSKVPNRLVAAQRNQSVQKWPDPSDADFARGTCFAASADGRRFAVVIDQSRQGTAARFTARLVVWDAEAQTKKVMETIHYGRMTALSFSPDGSRLVSGDSHGTVLLWRPQSGLREWRSERLYGHTQAVRRAEFESDGRKLVTESTDGDIIHWDLHRSQSLAIVLDDRRTTSMSEIGFTRVAFAQGGDTIVATGPHGQLLVWEGRDRSAPAREITVMQGVIRSLAVNNRGDWIAAASEKEIRAIHLNSGLEHSVPQPCRHVSGLSFSPDDELLAFGGVDCLQFWRYRAQVKPQPVNLPPPLTGKRVYSTVFSSDGSTLIVAGSFGVVDWSLAGDSLSQPPRLVYRGGLITRVAVNRDARQLATGNWNGEVVLISRDDSRSRPVNFIGHRGGAITGLAFSPDGDLLVSADANGTAMLWDLKRAEPLVKALRSGGFTASELAFSPDGSALAVGSDNRVVTVWPFGVNEWRPRACAIANRNLTHEEWTRYVGDLAYQASCRFTDGQADPLTE